MDHRIKHNFGLPEDGYISPRALASCDHCYNPSELPRAILEICAVTMPSWERNQLVGAYERDDLYEQIRLETCCFEVQQGIRGQMMIRRWYAITQQGQLAQLECLFYVIQLDPGAFLGLLK